MDQFKAEENQFSEIGDMESTNSMKREYDTSENVSYAHELDEPPVLQYTSQDDAVTPERDIASGLSTPPMERSHDNSVIATDKATEQISEQHGSPNNRRKKGPRKGRRQRAYDDATLHYMLKNIKNDSLTAHHASKYYGVPRSTLEYRLSKKYKHKGTPGPPTVLNDEEEQMIANWVKDQERKGVSITRQCVINKVANYIKEHPRKNNFRNNIPGKAWFKRFSEKYGVLTPTLFTFVSPKVTQTNINIWFKQIHQYLVENDLNDILKEPSRMLLCDEIWFPMNPSTRRVIGGEGSKETSLIESSSGTLGITVLYTFSADGAMIPPDVIVPCKQPTKQNIQSFPADWCVGGTDSGRIDTRNFILYVKKILYPCLVKSGVKLPVLYFVDTCKFQTILEAADACSKLGIIIIALYSNAHVQLGPILQPLKNNWKQVVEVAHTVNGINDFSTLEFGSLLQFAMKDGLKKSMIIHGFQECGLYPFHSKTIDRIDTTMCIASDEENVPGMRVMEEETDQVFQEQSMTPTAGALPTYLEQQATVSSPIATPVGPTATPVLKATDNSSKTRRPKQQPYTESMLLKALDEIRNHGGTVYSVAKQYGIPRTTLQYRLSEEYKHKGSKGPYTVFSVEEEKDIVRWLQTIERKGFPLTQSCLKFKIQSYLKSYPRATPFKDNIPGKTWFKLFMNRHPQLRKRAPESVTTASSKVSEKYIRNWFRSVYNYLEDNKLTDILNDPTRILNGDDTGFNLNSVPKQVIGTAGNKNLSFVETMCSKVNVTVMFSFSADGFVIPPHVILPQKRFTREILRSFPGDWGLGSSESGWMDTPNFIMYIKKILHPTLIKRGTKFPIIYFVDGHSSHSALEAADTCNQLGIILISLYPNATRILQLADQITSHLISERMTLATFGPLLEKTMAESFKKSTIIHGFSACGLFPYNPDAVDFSKCIAKCTGDQEVNLMINDVEDNGAKDYDSTLPTGDDSLTDDVFCTETVSLHEMINDGDCGGTKDYDTTDTCHETTEEPVVFSEIVDEESYTGTSIDYKQSIVGKASGMTSDTIDFNDTTVTYNETIGSKEYQNTITSATLGTQPRKEKTVDPSQSWPSNDLVSEIKIESTKILNIKEEPDVGLSEGEQTQTPPLMDIEEIKVEPVEIQNTTVKVEHNSQDSEPEPVAPLSKPIVTKNKAKLKQKAHCIFCSESTWKHKNEVKLDPSLRVAQREKIEYVLSVQLDCNSAPWCNRCWLTFEEFYNFKKFCLTALSNTDLLSSSDVINTNALDPNSLGQGRQLDADSAQKGPAKKQQLDKPKLSSISPSKHACEHCGKSYSSLTHLGKHKRCCIKPYDLISCRICSKKFNNAFKLRNHLIEHGQKPYQCRKVDCEKTFLYPHNLSSHENTCGQPVTFNCLICQQSFESDVAFQEHLTSHSEPGFPCQICNKLFTDTHHYEKHQLIHFQNNGTSSHTDNKKTSNSTEVSVTNRIVATTSNTSSYVSVEEQSGELGSYSTASTSRDALHSCDMCGMRYSFEEMLTKHQVYCNRPSLGESAEGQGDNGTSAVAYLTDPDAALVVCADEKQMELPASDDCLVDGNKSAATSGPKGHRQLKKYSPSTLEHIVERVRNGTLTRYKASQLYGIAQSTISYRLSKSYKKVSVVGTVLSTYEEQIIVSRLTDLKKKGFTLTDKFVQHFVSSFMKSSPETYKINRAPPGIRFIRYFLRRHPEIGLADPKLSEQSSESSTSKWFDTVREYLASNGLTDALHDPLRVFCGTEAEFHLELIKRKRSMTALEMAQADQNATVLFTFAADGNLVPPNIIFPCKHPSYDVVKSFPIDWGIISNATGRINAKNFVSYLKDVVHPCLIKKGVKFPVLYFVKGHTSNVVCEVAEQCATIGFILLAIPHNTTLQDIHVSITKPLENAWKQLTSSKIANSEENLTFTFFASWLKKSMEKTISRSSIANEFRTSGLHPFRTDTSDVLMRFVEAKSEASEVMSDENDANR